MLSIYEFHCVPSAAITAAAHHPVNPSAASSALNTEPGTTGVND
jgi:hypothetical protein